MGQLSFSRRASVVDIRWMITWACLLRAPWLVTAAPFGRRQDGVDSNDASGLPPQKLAIVIGVTVSIAVTALAIVSVIICINLAKRRRRRRAIARRELMKPWITTTTTTTVTTQSRNSSAHSRGDSTDSLSTVPSARPAPSRGLSSMNGGRDRRDRRHRRHGSEFSPLFEKAPSRNYQYIRREPPGAAVGLRPYSAHVVSETSSSRQGSSLSYRPEDFGAPRAPEPRGFTNMSPTVTDRVTTGSYRGWGLADQKLGAATPPRRKQSLAGRRGRPGPNPVKIPSPKSVMSKSRGKVMVYHG